MLYKGTAAVSCKTYATKSTYTHQQSLRVDVVFINRWAVAHATRSNFFLLCFGALPRVEQVFITRAKIFVSPERPALLSLD